MLSVCNVVIIAWEGAEVDYTLVQFVKRAETLKSALPDVTAPNPASQPAQSDTVVNPDIGKSTFFIYHTRKGGRLELRISLCVQQV